MDDGRRQYGVDTPVLRSDCAIHVTANAYIDLSNGVSEIEKVGEKLAAIAYLLVLAKQASKLEIFKNKQGLAMSRFS